MKTTLDLPDELIHAATLRAVAQGTPLQVLLTDFIRQGLGAGAGANPEPSPHLLFTPDGLPQVRCAAHAPARSASVAELLALEQMALQ